MNDPLPDVFDECDVLIVNASSHNDQLKITNVTYKITMISTVKPEHNDHLKIVVVVDRWSIFRGNFVL